MVEHKAPLTPTLSPGKARREGAKLHKNEVIRLTSVAPLSPGFAGGEGWGEGGSCALLTPDTHDNSTSNPVGQKGASFGDSRLFTQLLDHRIT
ncbi:hypothetical protein DYGSA30_05280 [Dyella sp. GSA-30]|nr:hypothetical protein DYGSA30_05280 [Dyella sp. GSA-30]